MFCDLYINKVVKNKAKKTSKKKKRKKERKKEKPNPNLQWFLTAEEKIQTPK